MLHSHHENHAGQSNLPTTKYHVQTSDVLQDMRVNVSIEGTDQVIWYKERFLEDKEIVENIVHNPTNTICWTIHRPLRGWYIRIRSPTFPPGVFIALTPVPSNAPYHAEAAMSFNSRTNIPISLPSSSGGGGDGETTARPILRTRESVDSQASSSSSVHSYPPTPSTPTPSSSPPRFPPETSGSSTSSTMTSPSQNPPARQRPISHIPSSQISQFILAPSSIPPGQTQGDQAASTSLFSRALSALKSHRPSHSNSFTICRVLHPPKPNSRGPGGERVSSPPPPYASTSSVALAPGAAQTDTAPTTTAGADVQSQPILHTPLLVFHDQTPLLTVRSLTGLIEMDQTEERKLGVDTSFWIAVALTYLEFLEERESYLAALSD